MTHDNEEKRVDEQEPEGAAAHDATEELSDDQLGDAAGGVSTSFTGTQRTQKVGLLLPAVQQVREAAPRSGSEPEPNT